MALSVSSRRVLKRPTTGSEKIAKYQRHKTSIILVLLCILLAAFLIGMGYLYAWLVSNQIMPNDAYNTQNYKPVEIKKPVARLNQRVNVAVSNISSPAIPGETVHLSIRTNVDAVCTLEVLTPVKKLIDATLGAKAADDHHGVGRSAKRRDGAGACAEQLQAALQRRLAALAPLDGG